MTFVRRLVTARQQLADQRDQVDAAEREDVRLYNAALSDGWTADELRRLGLGDGTHRSPVPSRRRHRGRGSGSGQAPAVDGVTPAGTDR